MIHFDFNLGAPVQCRDGSCGKLAGLVIDPETWRGTDLIIASGYLVTHDRVVPISKVQNTMDDKAYVGLSSSELEQYPEYQVKEYEVPASSLEQPTPKVALPYGLYGASEPTVPTVKQKIRGTLPR